MALTAGLRNLHKIFEALESGVQKSKPDFTLFRSGLWEY